MYQSGVPSGNRSDLSRKYDRSAKLWVRHLRTKTVRLYRVSFLAVFSLTFALLSEAKVTGNPKREFEVVSVRRHGQDTPRSWSYPLPGVDIMGADMTSIIAAAFDVDRDRILGGPGWTRTDFYDIRARTDESILKLSPQEQEEQIKMMLQSMLFQRFHFSFQSGTKVVQTYSLVASKSHLHLIPSTPEEKSSAVVGWGTMKLSNYSLHDLARQLSFSTHNIVTDNTNIQGKYDITLNWHPDDLSADDARPSLRDAIREQLGLDMKAGRSFGQTINIQRIDRPDPD